MRFCLPAHAHTHACANRHSTCQASSRLNDLSVIPLMYGLMRTVECWLLLLAVGCRLLPDALPLEDLIMNYEFIRAQISLRSSLDVYITIARCLRACVCSVQLALAPMTSALAH
jgi:hypothetical protein